jgi:hypothetical protein
MKSDGYGGFYDLSACFRVGMCGNHISIISILRLSTLPGDKLSFHKF